MLIKQLSWVKGFFLNDVFFFGIAVIKASECTFRQAIRLHLSDCAWRPDWPCGIQSERRMRGSTTLWNMPFSQIGAPQIHAIRVGE